MKPYLSVLLLGLLFLNACKEPPAPLPDPGYQMGNGFFILNEGNFQWGNASLDYYDQENDTLLRSVFETVNGEPLGDVLQSMEIIDSLAYLVVNNSGKIEVINPRTFRRVATISGLTSPRYVKAVDAERLWVTDLYDDSIAVVSRKTHQILRKIPLRGWSEVMSDNETGAIWVSLVNRPLVCHIDRNTETIIDSFMVAPGGGRFYTSTDAGQEQRLFCAGDPFQNVPAAVHHFFEGGPNGEVMAHPPIRFPLGVSPAQLDFGSGGTEYFFLASDNVYRMEEGKEIPRRPLIEGKGHNWYSLQYQEAEGRLFLADAADYVRRGWIHIYSRDGAVVDSVPAGIIPNGVVFFNP